MVTINPQKTFSKHLISLKAFYPNDKEIETIVKICELQPSEKEGWREWFSPFGTKLKASKRSLQISSRKRTFVSSDIFLYTHPAYMLDKTKILAYVNDHLVMWGDENILRVYTESDQSDIKEWQRVCPVSIGIESLRKIIQFDRLELTHDEQFNFDLLCRLPPTTESLQYLIETKKELCQTKLQIFNEVFLNM